MNVTKDVIIDLWPLYADGSASADSRALVEEYLRDHPDWSKKLQHSPPRSTWPSPAAITPDEEVQMLNRIKKRVQFVRTLMLLAMLFTAQAFGRIISDTSWDRSPRVFIIMAAIACGFWAWWCIASWRIRRLGP
jgi:hypothetical protein